MLFEPTPGGYAANPTGARQVLRIGAEIMLTQLEWERMIGGFEDDPEDEELDDDELDWEDEETPFDDEDDEDWDDDDEGEY